MERTLGSKIQWMKAPSVASVTKALESRILASVLAAFPEPAAALPGTPEEEVGEFETGAESEGGEGLTEPVFQTRLGRRLVERIGAEGAVEALIAASYGDLLDPSRYGTITEFSDAPRREGEGKQRLPKGKRLIPAGHPARFPTEAAVWGKHPQPHHESREGARGVFPAGTSSSNTRVYVGLGRRHGATARDVAGLLIRAGGIPGRLVDSIEMKDYCAFATLPEDAARRACAFSRNAPEDPAIKPASPGRRF
jgi:ATP-dependent RNA helicase DeaD